MQCTPQEIEQKRRLAQERLSNKIASKKIIVSNSNLEQFGASNSNSTVNSPNKHFLKGPSAVNSNKLTPYSKPQPLIRFYGKNNVITGTCALISEHRFAVELSAYSAPAVDVFKTLPSRCYDGKTRLWNFNFNDYELLHKKIATLRPDVFIGTLPPFAIQCCKMHKPDYSTIDLSSIDEELLNVLMPFQLEGVCFGIEKGGKCFIADDMGLGKTFQALAIANYYKEDWPLLIVTTSSMKNEWEATIHKYLPSVSVMHTQYMESSKDYIKDSKILIVSYDMMSRCVEKLLEHNFKVLIMDESHILKNFKTKCVKSATVLAQQASRIILLSGTPALSRPSELYTQLSLLDDKFFTNFFEYSKRYCDGKSSAYGWDSNGKSNLQELGIILTRKFMIRRTKEDVLKTLPDKEQEIVTLDVNLNQFTEEDRQHLNALAIQYSQLQKSSDKQALLLTFFSETSKIKIPSVCSFILQTLDVEKKFIVFAHHQKMLDAIEQVLFKKKKKFIRIDGRTSSSQRKYFVDKFQLNDEYECALLSITAACAGITLTAAKLVIFAELHWNPSILSQAESRAHRIGQEEKVIVKYLLAPGTADDSIWPMLQNKQKILKEAGLCKESFDNLNIVHQSKPMTKPTNTMLNYINKQSSDSNQGHGSNFETDDDFDMLINRDINIENLCSSKENLNTNTTHMETDAKLDLYNDDFDELIKNHDLIGNVDSAVCSVSFNHALKCTLSNSAEMEFLDDNFDEVLSNLEVNM